MTRASLWTTWVGATAVYLSGCGGGGSDQTSPVQWLGLDTRALAVGSAIPVSLQFATDGGAVSYTASSSDGAVVAVADQGNQQLLLSVLAPGNATLTVASNFGSASRPVIAAQPASVTFVLLDRLKAAQSPDLPPAVAVLPANGFALVSAGSETIQAQVLDNGGNQLNSWGLVHGNAGGSAEVGVTKSEPEQFTLTGSRLTDTGNVPNFVAGLIDAGQSSSYPVSVVSSASTATLVSNPPLDSVVVAQALALDGKTEVFGLGDWQFTCQPANQCTSDQLSLSSAQLTLPTGADAGSFTVTASVAASPGSSTALTGLVKLP